MGKGSMRTWFLKQFLNAVKLACGDLKEYANARVSYEYMPTEMDALI